MSETRGRVLTYKGAPVNALYTSTCGGRTEDGENIFGGAPVPYLRGRECALEGEHFAELDVRPTASPPTSSRPAPDEARGSRAARRPRLNLPATERRVVVVELAPEEVREPV